MRCNKCGYHKRGKNHEEGEHHNKGEFGHTDTRKIEKIKEFLR